MQAFTGFCLSFFFSIVGSLPPGTVNLSSVQLGLDNKPQLAWRLAAAAAIAEYFYAYLAVTFEGFITSSPLVVKNFHLVAALVMLVLGILNIRTRNKPSALSQRFYNSGFRRGLVLGFLNPLAMPFWIGITAYLKSQHWINLDSSLRLHAYLLGVSLGVFTLLVTVAYMANRVIRLFNKSHVIASIPGYLMLGLGIYALIRYFFMMTG
ncbi:LysE family transporter [Foetidibacter luteolus]|uniref:LysE family transporter n=1 Tax=Foetidibacter luteolus TaxID=2608880 RepID=UPI001A998059|nr:LysE family transporter [Foetidibacter luteolus]